MFSLHIIPMTAFTDMATTNRKKFGFTSGFSLTRLDDTSSHHDRIFIMVVCSTFHNKIA